MKTLKNDLVGLGLGLLMMVGFVIVSAILIELTA